MRGLFGERGDPFDLSSSSVQRDKIYSLPGPTLQPYFNGPLPPEVSFHWFLMSAFIRIIPLCCNVR